LLVEAQKKGTQPINLQIKVLQNRGREIRLTVERGGKDLLVKPKITGMVLRLTQGGGTKRT